MHDAEDVLAAILKPASDAGEVLRAAIVRKAHLDHHTSTSTDILDPSRLSLSGFSSGGNLALNLATSVKTDSCTWPSLIPEHGETKIPTLLFFPSFDQTLLPHERPIPSHLRHHFNVPDTETTTTANDPSDTDSATTSATDTEKPLSDAKRAPKNHSPNDGTNSSGLRLSQILGPTYLPHHQRTHPRASPGLVPNLHSSLHPRARFFLVLPEIDSLAPQSEAWLVRMRECGREEDVKVERCRGMKHGWTQFPDFVLGRKGRREKYRVFEGAGTFLDEVGG